MDKVTSQGFIQTLLCFSTVLFFLLSNLKKLEERNTVIHTTFFFFFLFLGQINLNYMFFIVYKYGHQIPLHIFSI